jgi:LptD protein
MSERFAIPLRKVVNFSQIGKPLAIKTEGLHSVSRLVLFITGLLIGFALPVRAQVERPIKAPSGQLPVQGDTLILPPDSLNIQSDTLSTNRDSLNQTKKGDIETTIFYSARDSINSNLNTKIIRLYGDAKIKYGEIELQAEEIEIDYEKSTITANGRLDSAGRRMGFPIFKNGAETYETRDMTYNFKTKRARISEVVTKQGDGFIHGEAVFKNDKNELFSISNAYTTCNLAVPHFRIISRRSKAIPGDKIISGPFYMEFNGVPTPLMFAFGVFPSKQKAASGLIIPKYGEEGRRGFFLKQGGYFFDINDYIKIQLTGDIYSKGSSAATLNTVYRNRYKYSGNFNFAFTNNRVSDKIEDKSTTKDFRVTWSHTPQTKGTGRFSASLNAASSSYNSNNLLALNNNPQVARLDNTTQKMSSNISYSKSFAGTPLSFGINLRHNQDLRTKQIDIPAPDVSFNVNNLYPFKTSTGKIDFLQNMSIRYTMTGTNSISNNLGRIGKLDANGNRTDSIAPFNLTTIPFFFDKAKRGVRHNIPLATSMKLLKNFAVSPGLSYDELWYFERIEWGLNDRGTAVVAKDTLKQFSRIANYSGSIGMTTRLYGMFVSRNPDSKIKAIRHVINPSVSYSFQPDFGDPKYGYYQTFQVRDSTRSAALPPTYTIVQKSRYENGIYGSSRTGKSSSMGFSINNNLEMKVKGKDDSVARKISLLNTFSISSSYNFAADSFKLSNFSLSANTNVLNDKINLNMSANIDPYQYLTLSTNEKTGQITQLRVSRYAWDQQRFSLGQVTNANFAFSTNLSPKGQKSDKETRDKISKSDLSPGDKNFLLQNPDAYIDFEIPWNLRVSANVDYAKNGRDKARITKTVRFNGDVSLSQKWKIGFNSGFDFDSKQFSQTNLTLNRELHCWQMSLGWVPFGKFQSYTFSIGVKSSLLQDLKLDRQRSFFDN